MRGHNMKIKNMFVVLLLLMVSRVAVATKFSIVNEVGIQGRLLDVKPYWTGSTEPFWGINPFQNKYYDSGSHHLKYIQWRDPITKECWSANVEDVLGGLFDRIRQNVIIRIYGAGKYTIDLKGTSTLKNKTGEGMPRQAQRGNCEMSNIPNR